MAMEQPVAFEVLSIGPGDKSNFAKVELRFNNSSKQYTYYRKMGKASYNRHFVVIDGCRILFTKGYELVSVTREYDIKGHKRQTTEGLSKKIKEETQDKGILPDLLEDDEEWEDDVEADTEVELAALKEDKPEPP